MIHFQTSVRIDRAREEVFAVVSDPSSYPLWNSAVDEVRPLAGSGERARFVMSRTLPTGRATNALEVVEEAPPDRVVIRASDGPTPFVYRYQLHGDGRETILTLDADVELDGLFRLAGPLVARTVKLGVEENFRRLKRLVETR